MGRKYPSYPFVGTGAVILDGEKILLVKRANEPNRGLWSVPGGVVRLGETLHSALIREVKEETGLDIEVKDVACVSEEIFRNGDIRFHYVIIDFFAEIKSGELRAGSDAMDVGWFSFDEVEEIEAVDFIKKLVKTLKSGEGGIYLR